MEPHSFQFVIIQYVTINEMVNIRTLSIIDSGIKESRINIAQKMSNGNTMSLMNVCVRFEILSVSKTTHV